MSYQVIGDPDEIQAFSDHLSEYCRATLESLQTVKHRLGDMESNQTWADARYHEYRSNFDEVSGRLENTLRQIEDEHIPHLRSIADRLRAVHEA